MKELKNEGIKELSFACGVIRFASLELRESFDCHFGSQYVNDFI